MKKILAIIRKDIRLRFAGPSEWLFFLILPIVFTLILAGGTAGAGDARIRLLVVDQANTSLSAELIAALGKSEAIRPQVAPLATAESEFSQRRVSAVLIIPAAFDVPQLRAGVAELELRQQPNNLNALIAYRAVTAVISRLGSAAEIAESSTAEAERIRPFETAAARQAYFDASLAAAQTSLAQSPARVAVVVGTAKDQIEYDSAASSSAGQMITWVFIPLLGISGMFAYERQKGTLRRLLTTPTRRPTYLLGTISGQVATALVQMLLLVGFGAIVLHLELGPVPRGPGGHAAHLRAGGRRAGDHPGHVRQDRGAGRGVEHDAGDGDGAARRLLVPHRAVPAVRPDRRQGAADHLGDAGDARHRHARRRADRRPAAGDRAGGICGRVLCHRGLAVPL